MKTVKERRKRTASIWINCPGSGKILPNIVNTDSEGYKSVNYNELIPLLLKNAQEQDKRIKELQKKYRN
jgi:hypothetical protein